jgi:hypothetical protein
MAAIRLILLFGHKVNWNAGPMDISRFSFFGNAANDAQLLAQWRSAPLTFRAGDALPNAHSDDYDVIVREHATPDHFARAADLLLRYRFYPPDVMLHTSDFEQQRRRMKVGDRIVQRIHILPGLDVLTMNEVVRVTNEPRHAGFAYATTQKHDEVGQWSAEVTLDDAGALHLRIHSIGKANLPFFMRPIARRIQLRAHRRGIDTFKAALG